MRSEYYLAQHQLEREYEIDLARLVEEGGAEYRRKKETLDCRYLLDCEHLLHDYERDTGSVEFGFYLIFSAEA